jgi:hypothetical protein
MPRGVHVEHVPGSVRCRVIAKLQGGVWRVLLGVGEGHVMGGVEVDLDEDALPREVRRPNAEFYLTP